MSLLLQNSHIPLYLPEKIKFPKHKTIYPKIKETCLKINEYQ